MTDHFLFSTYMLEKDYKLLFPCFKNIFVGWGQGGEMAQAMYAHVNK
jgi:hypothetical protein